MDPQQQFCLKWNSFGNNLVNTFDHLYQSASLTDVTLFCEGVTFQAHKLILAACSKHFQDLFESAPISPSILVILDGTSSRNMSALLEFMYKGEVHVAQDCLSSFLKAAEYLQVKGLSIEHERLVSSQPAQSVESRIDSPVSRSSKSKIGSNNHDDGGLLTSGGAGRTSHTPESESMGRPPPSSTPSYSAAYPISHYSKTMQHYEQHIPSPLSFQSLGTENYTSSSSSSRKRMHRSPSDQLRTDKQRPSVLRDGKAEYTSPMMYDPIPQAVPISTMTPPSDMPKQTAAVVENSSLSSPPSWHSNTNGAEDLRVKNEPTESGNSVDENGTKYYSMHGVENAQREREMADRIPPLPPLIPSPSGPPASSTPWKVEQPHRGIASTTTQDGKKLQCPYCERLYGYETNLRAHIRQRHQGIRVPCPFCSRTFTRNNTVRRHIAREHKTEIGIKPPNPPPPTHSQVQNHNQQP